MSIMPLGRDLAMLHEDFIMRALQQLVAAIVRAVRDREVEDHEGSDAALQSATKELAGLNIDDILRMSVAGILELFTTEEKLEVEQAAMMARLLKEFGELQDSRGDPERARTSYVKAFCLYDELERSLENGLSGLLDPPGLTELGSHPETLAWLVGKLE